LCETPVEGGDAHKAACLPPLNSANGAWGERNTQAWAQVAVVSFVLSAVLDLGGYVGGAD
jgi:hypothetical protein